MLAKASRPIDPSHAVYDGKQLKSASYDLVIGINDKRWALVTQIVVLPGVTALHENAFAGFISLTSVILPLGLITIGRLAFNCCTSLSSIALPEGLTTIGGVAFSGCTSLASVSLPEGLTKIGGLAFSRCTPLASIILPSGLTTIGMGAFYDCRILEQRSRAAGRSNVEAYLRFISSPANRRYAVLASLKRLRDELYARQAKRAWHKAEEEEEEELLEEEQAGVLNGALAFDIIHSDDLWRHILEFVWAVLVRGACRVTGK